MPNLNTSILGALPFVLPPLDRQHEIAAVLSALDNKIELNRRMNETLEGMAQAIFKDWFVEFGPTRRKLAGTTDPVAIMGGLTPDTARATGLAALFRDALGDDGLPVGWKLGRVEETVELAYGKSLPKTERADGPFPVYGSGGVTGTHISALVKGPGIIVGRKGTVGSLYWEQDDFFPIDTVFYVRPEAGFSLEQIWFLLGSLGLEHMNTDAAVPGLNRNNVYRLEVPIAPGIINDEFCKLASPLRAKTQSNLAENCTLAETRDYLLPKLMSGEVRVRDAEKMMDV
jgi:type I restriction enzyme, S subunit